jgi:hypothetical protein
MVFVSEQGRDDINGIFYSLLHWQKIELEEAFCHSYVSDILDFVLQVDGLSVHLKSKYLSHQRYGTYTAVYTRNARTNWYIIYDVDEFGNAYIRKIMNNYLTIV